VHWVEVVVPLPLFSSLTYALPLHLQGLVQVGNRVVVEVGRQRLAGVVIALSSVAPPPSVRTKDVLDVVEPEPILSASMLRFLHELAAYYFSPLGEVVRLAVPAIAREDGERLGNAKTGRMIGGRRIQFVSMGALTEAPPTLKGNALAIFHFLQANGTTPVAHLARTWKNARAVVAKLAEQSVVHLENKEPPRDAYFREPIPIQDAPEPTEAQQHAVTCIETALAANVHHTFLLHGVTGSGKTEVYLRAVAAAKAAGRGSIVLVPEIALTPQLVARFRSRFGDKLAVLHSGLLDRDRLAMWKSLRRGEVDMVIGARSALFAPVEPLGLLIVDEEHDPSFKQEEGVRYHARDMAILRAYRNQAVCILGSATPSMESEHLCHTGKMTKLLLPHRAREGALLPDIVTVDLRRTDAGPLGDRRISLPLHRRICDALEKKEQVVLFLNRRGFAPSVVCESCGTIATCTQCSVPLTYHRPGRLRCHYCDSEHVYRAACSACGSSQVTLEGAGTERLEEVVQQSFPQARIARIDRDVASGTRAEAIFERMHTGEVDILIGTQMVAKGHDIPNVTLVGIINADAALHMPDFRASERTFQLLVQVSGRAGRGVKRGTVVLQTRDPAHPAIALAKSHDVDTFAQRELSLRAELGYPPFARLALLRIDAVKEDVAREVATTLARVAAATAVVRQGQADVLGPAAAPLARLRGRYRYRFLVKARKRSDLRRVLVAVQEAMTLVRRNQARVVIDVDPISMM